jgi:hypothetical protein
MKDVQGIEGQPVMKGSEGNEMSVDVEEDETEALLSGHDQAAGNDFVHPPPDGIGNDNPTETCNIVQGPINLLGVDVQRVYSFCGYNNLLIGSFLKILLAVWFLVILIGWWR